MPAARMAATSRKRSSGGRRVTSAQLDIREIAPKDRRTRGRERGRRWREAESRGRMLLTYRTQIQVVGKAGVCFLDKSVSRFILQTLREFSLGGAL